MDVLITLAHLIPRVEAPLQEGQAMATKGCPLLYLPISRGILPGMQVDDPILIPDSWASLQRVSSGRKSSELGLRGMTLS